MPTNHAILSASSSHRWIECPPSAKLCAELPDTSSEYAQEGTDAHTLCEHRLKALLGRETTDPTENLTYYNEEMERCAVEYATYAYEQVKKAKVACNDPIVLIEQKLDFSRWVPEGFGTGDCVIVADGTLSVIDFKYGKGVEVRAENNPQMMLYALGALELFDGIYDISAVNMIIFQPRRDNISEYAISKEELLRWANEILTPTAQLAANGDGDFKAGKHCRFCKVRATCRKLAEYNLALARYDFEPPATLDNIEIAAILAKADELVSWVTDVKEYALRQALSGVSYDGFKVVEGRSNRKYTDENEVVEAVKSAGYDPYEHSVLGITAMTSLLGKKKFNELLGGLIEKPQGKPTLVSISDKRPAIHTANEDFKEENNMPKFTNPTNVITGPDARWSYANIWEAKSINGGAPKFSVSLIIPKSDTRTVEKIKVAIEAAYKEGESKLKGNGRSVPALSAIKNPLRDGDTERPDDEAYANSYFINANSATAPGIVDANCNPILERSEVYSGVYGRASISFYAFNSNGNKGIACGLNNLQKIRDGEPLGGRTRAEDDFATDDDDDFLS